MPEEKLSNHGSIHERPACRFDALRYLSVARQISVAFDAVAANRFTHPTLRQHLEREFDVPLIEHLVRL